MAKQIDMFVEAEDRKLFADLSEIGICMIQPFVDNLPSEPYITVSDIKLCFNNIFSNSGKGFSESNVYRWLDAGLIHELPVQSGEKDEKKRHMIFRASFLSFIKSRINAI